MNENQKIIGSAAFHDPGARRSGGLYRVRNGLPEFVILTREPGEGIRFLHDRMPLILPENAIDDWISPDSEPNKVVEKAVTDVVIEKAV